MTEALDLHKAQERFALHKETPEDVTLLKDFLGPEGFDKMEKTRSEEKAATDNKDEKEKKAAEEKSAQEAQKLEEEAEDAKKRKAEEAAADRQKKALEILAEARKERDANQAKIKAEATDESGSPMEAFDEWKKKHEEEALAEKKAEEAAKRAEKEAEDISKRASEMAEDERKRLREEAMEMARQKKLLADEKTRRILEDEKAKREKQAEREKQEALAIQKTPVAAHPVASPTEAMDALTGNDDFGVRNIVEPGKA